MSRIGERFDSLRRGGSKGLITYITAGDPDLGTTSRLATAMAAPTSSNWEFPFQIPWPMEPPSSGPLKEPWSEVSIWPPF